MMSENKSAEISQAERLSAAIRVGDADAVKAFIDAGGDVNCRNLDNVTPLHIAAQYGDLDIVRTLVDAGADVFATVKTQYDEDYSAADIAYSYEHREAFDFISTAQQEQIQKRRDAHKLQREKLFSAINAQQPDIVREVVAEGADVNEWEEFVADRDDEAKKRVLLTPLCAAIKNGGNAEVVKVLLEAGADVNYSTSSILEWKSGRSCSEIYPLSYAVEADNAEIVELLLSAGADADRGIDGDWDHESVDVNPLYKAVENGNYEIAKLLLKSGARPDAYVGDSKGAWSESALGCAIRNDNIELIKLLLDFGADINGGVDEYFNTPLTYAAFSGKTEIVRELIKLGANVDLKDKMEEMIESDVSPEILKIIKDAAQKQKRKG